MASRASSRITFAMNKGLCVFYVMVASSSLIRLTLTCVNEEKYHDAGTPNSKLNESPKIDDEVHGLLPIVCELWRH